MGAVPGAVGRSRFRPSALPIRVVAGMALLASTLGGPSTALAVDTGPPTILFAGEIGTAPSYDHVIVVYDERLDESVTPSAVNFRVEIDGVDYTPDAVTFLLSGLPNLGDPFDPGGATFLQLDLPAPTTIGPATTSLQVTYTPGLGPNPIRDLSGLPAEFATLAGELYDSSFAFLFSIVDGGHGADRVALVFGGQIDLVSLPLPLPGEFVVAVTPFGGVAGPATVIGVEAVYPDLGLGILDLVMASPIKYDDSVEVIYNAPGTSIKSRNETGVTAGTFSSSVLVLLPVNVASGTGSATTATEGFPTVADPVATTVTSPSGGAVSIDEVPIDPAPPGYSFFGEQVEITAPPADGPATPLVLRFEIDASLIPLGQTYLSAIVLRNNVEIPACMGPPGEADPTPCVSLRELIPGGGGDIAITVLTVEASTYNFASVPFAFSGLRWPVANPPTSNRVVAGLPIPLRFSLGGDRGLGVFSTGYPASGTVGCTFAVPPATLLKTVASRGLPLHYTAWNDTYLYLWQTDRAWRGTCRTLVISFADGTSAQAFFDFRR